MTRNPKERAPEPKLPKKIRPEDLAGLENMTQEKGLRIPRPDVGSDTLEMTKEQAEQAQRAAEEPKRPSPGDTMRLPSLQRTPEEEQALNVARQDLLNAFEPEPQTPEVATYETQGTESTEPAEVPTDELATPEPSESGPEQAEVYETLPPSELAPFTKEQLSFVLNKSLEAARAYKETDNETTRASLGQFKILFDRAVVFEHRDLLEKKIGYSLADLSQLPESYSGEDPAVIEKLLKPLRSKLLTVEHPFLVMSYKEKPKATDPADQLEIKVKKIVPELQRTILAGRAQAADFEEAVSRFGQAAPVVMERLRLAERAHERLTPEEWQIVDRAADVLGDPNEKRLTATKSFLHDQLPVFAASARAQLKEKPNALKVVEQDAKGMLNLWLSRLDTEERAAAEKYVSTAVEMYSGTLSQKS